MYNFGAIDPHILQQVSDDNTANKRQKYIFQNLLITPKPWKIWLLTNELNWYAQAYTVKVTAHLHQKQSGEIKYNMIL